VNPPNTYPIPNLGRSRPTKYLVLNLVDLSTKFSTRVYTAVYEIMPELPAPVAVACRDAKSNPCFTRMHTVVLQITSMGNLSEK
jgi:hypothetical protein